MDNFLKRQFPYFDDFKNVKLDFFSKKVLFFSCGLLAVLLAYFFIFSAPSNFPVDGIFQVEQGMNLRAISLALKDENLIRSRTAFEAFVILYGGEKHILSSDYLFDRKLPVYEIARRIVAGERHTAPIVVTIPEGFDVFQISDAFSSKLNDFKKERFLLDAVPKEGYLFPDTYYFFSTDTDKIALFSMTNNFNKKIKPLLPEITDSGKTEQEIITMASVIEREAKGDQDRGIISGILWKRIKLGMPLQVDAAPETYKEKGLPKNPISNPGIQAIKAAIHPESSPYLYYLHDANGNIYYAKTFKEHVMNKKKYLPK